MSIAPILASLVVAASAAAPAAARRGSLLPVLEGLDLDDPAPGLEKLFDGGAPRKAEAPPDGRGPRSAAEMAATLDFIRYVFKAGYAPAGWKARHAGWDLDREIDAAKAELASIPSPGVRDFQRVVRKVIASTRDYHVSVRFAATESASLPFQVARSFGRFFIAWIDRDKLSESSFPFQAGDELVELGGRTAAAAARELQELSGRNVDGTDAALAALRLTRRSAATGLEVPRDPVVVGIRRKGAQAVVTRQLAWDYTPESVEFQPRFEPPAPPALSTQEGFFDPRDRGAAASGRRPEMLSPLSRELAGDNPFAIGARKSWVPDLGEKLWEAGGDEPLYAYLYRAPDNRIIGYVRIPSYTPSDAAKAVKQFGELMAKFEKAADALVIDQVNNPGGAVFYLYALASMLSDQALRTPRHRVSITQNDVVDASKLLALEPHVKNDEDAKAKLGAELSGYPVSYQAFRYLVQYARFLIDQWNAGRVLSAPTHLYAVDHINPSTVARFTKPILLLINELDFSGGDFFPAILQDNKRATLFGARTAGAGGYVGQVEFPNALGVQSFSYTGSIAERVDGEPIENLGVRPEIEHAPGAEDAQDGFKGYAKAVNEAVLGLLKK
ncbi:MAG: protease-like activity factor CPAF [Elusimicrobia bacterium]|nr:protease-like activity factor CPAF [Elusimicrobiota bacterium]